MSLYNIRTLSENIIFFVRALETDRKGETLASFSYLFHRGEKLIVYLLTMYVYCVYLAMTKCLKQLPNCLIRANNRLSNRFKWCPLRHPRLYCYRFITVALHDKGMMISISVTAEKYSRNVLSALYMQISFI
jgi:hypothetical protein